MSENTVEINWIEEKVFALEALANAIITLLLVGILAG